MTRVIETDCRGRVVLPGHANQSFLLQEQEDGSILLQPAEVVRGAQFEYDGDPELRPLLGRAAKSPIVQRTLNRS